MRRSSLIVPLLVSSTAWLYACGRFGYERLTLDETENTGGATSGTGAVAGTAAGGTIGAGADGGTGSGAGQSGGPDGGAGAASGGLGGSGSSAGTSAGGSSGNGGTTGGGTGGASGDGGSAGQPAAGGMSGTGGTGGATATGGAGGTNNTGGTGGTSILEPLGYWRFDEGSGTTASDSSGNGNHGSFVGSPLPTWTIGRYGGGLDVTGAGSAVVVLSSASINHIATTSQFTVALWMKATSISPSSFECFVSRQYQLTDAEHYGLYLLRGELTFIADTTTSRCGDKLKLVADTWYHLAGTFDGATARAYRDGVEACSVAASGTRSDTTPLIFGGNVNSAGTIAEESSAVLDEILLFGRALSAAEIAALAAATAPYGG